MNTNKLKRFARAVRRQLGEKTAALKVILQRLDQTLKELRAYEREVLFPLAANPIEIDLDDGVKVNYAKFGKALARVAGLNNIPK